MRANSRHHDWVQAARQQVETADAAGSSLETGPPLNRTGTIRLPDDRFPGYQLEEEIHRGGQGIVYAGIQKSTGRRVALKVLRDSVFSGPLERSRFEREAQILTTLQHPNIVGVYDCGTVTANPYLVMEFIDGRPLDQYVAGNRPTIDALVGLFVTICKAVNAAHLRGIIHRDLKPSNIRVDRAGVPHVLDFGLARVTTAEAELILSGAMDDSSSLPAPRTITGQFVGSLPWAAPEQIDGDPVNIDTRTDVYALGVVLYQLLTGRFPYPVVGRMRVVMDHVLDSSPVSPRIYRPEIDDELATIVLKCLAKDRERRYQTAGELARDLERYLTDQPIEAKRDNGWYVMCKLIDRYRGRVGVLCAFVLLAIGSSISLSVLHNRQAGLLQERDTAATKAQAELEKSSQTARFVQEILLGIDPAVAGDLDKRLMRLVLDNAAARVESELAGQPEVEAAIRQTIGAAYVAIGDWSAAESHLERALQIRRALGGDEAPTTLLTASGLGELYMEQGRFAEADPLLSEVLASRRRLLGSLHIDTLKSVCILGQLRRNQGRHADAEVLCREALMNCTATVGPEHPQTLTAMNGLSTLLLGIGQLEEAQSLLEKTLELERKVRGPQHPHTLVVMNNLAITYYLRDKHAESEAIQREAIDLCRVIMGNDHPKTLLFQSNLAGMYIVSGALDEARTLLESTLATQIRVLGPDHLQVADSLHRLATIAVKRKDYLPAETWNREVLRISKKALPAGHSQIAMASIELGETLMHLGRYEDAEPLLIAGQAGIADKPDAGLEWEPKSIKSLIELYENWDTANPGSGKAGQAANWRVRLNQLQNPASAPTSTQAR